MFAGIEEYKYLNETNAVCVDIGMQITKGSIEAKISMVSSEFTE